MKNKNIIIGICWYVFLCAVATILAIYLRNIGHKEIVPVVAPTVVELKLPETPKSNKIKYVHTQTAASKCEPVVEVKPEVKLEPVPKPVEPLSQFDMDLLEFERKL
jgi:hypothetical protein